MTISPQASPTHLFGPRKNALTMVAVWLLMAVSTPTWAGQDPAPTREIDAGGLVFEVPESWKSIRPSSTMRRAQLQIDPVEGDSKPAEMAVFAFPGGGGTVQANINRWQNQFRNEDGGPAEIEVNEVEGQNAKVIVVQAAGRYVTQIPRPIDEPGYRLLGAIVVTRQTGYFLKMVGPDKTMQTAKPAFDELAKSLKVTE